MKAKAESDCLDSQLSTFKFQLKCRCGRCPAGSHKASLPGSIPGPATETRHRGWASAQRGLISLDGRVRHPDTRTPGPATLIDGRVRKPPAKRPARESGDFVGSTPPRLLTGPVVQRQGASPTCWQRWFDSIRDQIQESEIRSQRSADHSSVVVLTSDL